MSATRRPCRTWLVLALALSTSGCFGAVHKSSPAEFGLGARVAPAFAVGAGDLTAHPMLSYTRLFFDGGHDSLWELGGQVRKPLAADAAGGRALWIGGEAALSRLTTVVDVGTGDFSTSTNGFSLTALVGTPVGQSRWGLNLYGGAGISNYGSTGFNLRVGVDLQPWFLAR